MKTRRFLSFLLLFLVSIHAGCTKKEETVYSVNGNYTGIVKSGSGTQTSTLKMVLVQNDSQITGTYTITGAINESGTVSGNILGLIFNFTLKRILPTAGTFSGSVNISNGTDKLAGSYGNETYTFELTRQ